MAKILESKSKTAPSKPKTKICAHCGAAKSITDFYGNKGWEEQLKYDIWCKACVNKCTTKEQMKEYFWENNRAWTESIWNSAVRRAENLARMNTVYQNANEERRKVILEKLACQQIPVTMQSNSLYKYEPHDKDGERISYKEAISNGLLDKEEDPNERIYSQKFNGNFRPHELVYLENYYENLGGDDLDTENLRDYVKKLAKASLQADKAQDDYAAGRCDFSVVKDALALFDMLSKSSNLAACKRKASDTFQTTSWSEISMALETNGHPCTRKIEWEKDDVDRTIDEFRYIVQAMGFDGE